MKFKIYSILGILLVTLSIPAFSQDESTIREVRRLRANAAYLEMKGDLQGALEDFEKSLELLPNENIEAKVIELKTALGLIEPDNIRPEETVAPDPEIPDEEVAEQEGQEENTSQAEVETAKEPVETTQEDVANELPEPTPIPDDLTSQLPEDLLTAIEAADLMDEELIGIDLQELENRFVGNLDAVADAEAAYDVLWDYTNKLKNYTWEDAEGMLQIYSLFLERYPDYKDAENIEEEIIELAAKCHRWDEVLAYHQDLLTKYRLEENEYREMSALLALIHLNLCKGDLATAQTIFDEMKQLDPTIHDDQTRTADFIFRNLDKLVIHEPDPETAGTTHSANRHLIRKYAKVREIVENPGDWLLNEAQIHELDKILFATANALHDQTEKRYDRIAGHYFLTSTSEGLMTDSEWVSTSKSFMNNYWYDELADEVRRNLRAYFDENAQLSQIAELKEVLLWEDIDSITSPVNEYYRAIEIAEAWKDAADLPMAKKWYETAIELDQYGEWSKTDGVVEALGKIAEQLPAEPEVVLPELSAEEQEALASEIIARLSELPNDKVREFEKGYLEIINRCPESSAAEEAYWRIGNLYRLAYSEPKYDKVIPLYEQFLVQYPGSEGVPMIANALANSLSETGNWDRLVEIESTYFLTVLPDEPTDQDIARYCLHGDHLTKAGNTDAAARWYALVLQQDPDRSTFSSRVAEEGLAELGFKSPEAIAAIPVAVAYD